MTRMLESASKDDGVVSGLYAAMCGVVCPLSGITDKTAMPASLAALKSKSLS
jgi:hypothetical protein